MQEIFLRNLSDILYLTYNAEVKRIFTIRFRHLLKTMHRYKLVYYVDVNFSTDKTDFYRVFFHLFIRVFHIQFPYL